MTKKVKKTEMFLCRMSKPGRGKLKRVAAAAGLHPSDWFRMIVEREHLQLQQTKAGAA